MRRVVFVFMALVLAGVFALQLKIAAIVWSWNVDQVKARPRQSLIAFGLWLVLVFVFVLIWNAVLRR